MKPQLYGAIGIALGLLAFVMGLQLVFADRQGNYDLGFIGLILLLGGTFVFGCGLVAAAIGTRK